MNGGMSFIDEKGIKAPLSDTPHDVYVDMVVSGRRIIEASTRDGHVLIST